MLSTVRSTHGGSANIDYVIGVDGGGTGTRVGVARPDGTLLAQANAGPSALGQGVESAWGQIQLAVTDAFRSVGIPPAPADRCVLAAGLSGYGHKPWRDDFLARNPGFACVMVESDGYAMLMGAHGGQPGVMVTAGTGSIGEALYADGSRREVGGWGFPVGDEGSGAWLGLRAMAHTQAVQDGRMPPGNLAHKVLDHCGGSAEALLAWCSDARQFKYAQLALLVFEAADAESQPDPVAISLLDDAAHALECLADVLDPHAQMPVAVCGSVGQRLQTRLSNALQSRCVAPAHDASYGALMLAMNFLETME